MMLTRAMKNFVSCFNDIGYFCQEMEVINFIIKLYTFLCKKEVINFLIIFARIHAINAFEIFFHRNYIFNIFLRKPF